MPGAGTGMARGVNTSGPPWAAISTAIISLGTLMA
jgi:hypothetical protein